MMDRQKETDYIFDKINSLTENQFDSFYRVFTSLCELVECDESESDDTIAITETLGETLGKCLLDLRETRKISREIIAEKMGKKVKFIKDLEGGIKVDFSDLDEILKFINITPITFFNKISTHITVNQINLTGAGNIIINEKTEVYKQLYSILISKYEKNTKVLDEMIKNEGICNLYIKLYQKNVYK